MIIVRIILAIWVAIAIFTIVAALARITYGLLCGLLALIAYGLAYALQGFDWLWRHAWRQGCAP